MKRIKVSAPGKIHLLGEHVVVYGKPAFLAAINKRVYVEIVSRKDDNKEIIIKNNHDEKFVTYVNYAIFVTEKYYRQKLQSGYTLTISSEIPVGSGMGSSAATAVAIAGAITLFLDQPFDKEKINEIAFLIEKYIHKNPSGGDTSASCYGGFIWYRRETDELKIIKQLSVKLSRKIAKNFYIVDTGKPKETTGEMIELVKKFVAKNKKQAEKIFDNQEKLTKNLFSALTDTNEMEIKKIIKKGQRNLEKLGVVSPSVRKIIRHIEKLGSAAKICGGGGKTMGTGVLLVYQNNRVNSLYEHLTLGTKGVTIHE